MEAKSNWYLIMYPQSLRKFKSFLKENLKKRGEASAAFDVFTTIYARCDFEHRAFPSLDTIVKESFHSINVVKKAIRHLCDLGVVSKHQRTDEEGRFLSNEYTLSVNGIMIFRQEFAHPVLVDSGGDKDSPWHTECATGSDSPWHTQRSAVERSAVECATKRNMNLKEESEVKRVIGIHGHEGQHNVIKKEKENSITTPSQTPRLVEPDELEKDRYIEEMNMMLARGKNDKVLRAAIVEYDIAREVMVENLIEQCWRAGTSVDTVERYLADRLKKNAMGIKAYGVKEKVDHSKIEKDAQRIFELALKHFRPYRGKGEDWLSKELETYKTILRNGYMDKYALTLYVLLLTKYDAHPDYPGRIMQVYHDPAPRWNELKPNFAWLLKQAKGDKDLQKHIDRLSKLSNHELLNQNQ